MQIDDIELKVIKNVNAPDHLFIAIQTNYKNRVYIVSFKKYSAPRDMEWGATYEYSTCMFLGNEDGKISDYSPLITSYDNDPNEEMALRYVKRLLMDLIESDNE